MPRSTEPDVVRCRQQRHQRRQPAAADIISQSTARVCPTGAQASWGRWDQRRHPPDQSNTVAYR
eukprot:3182293-Prymnesium_polylepis.1